MEAGKWQKQVYTSGLGMESQHLPKRYGDKGGRQEMNLKWRKTLSIRVSQAAGAGARARRGGAPKGKCWNTDS